MFDELSASDRNISCVWFDGGDEVSTVRDIVFTRCTLIGERTTVLTSNDYVKDITFDNCILDCRGDVLSGAQVRINSNSSDNLGEFTFRDCKITGNGGINYSGTGEEGSITIERCKWYPSDPDEIYATTNQFAINLLVPATIENNTIDFSKNEWSGTDDVTPYIPEGTFKGNVLESVSSALIKWNDLQLNSGFIIRENTWGEYSYYDGPTAQLTLKSQTSAVQLPDVSGGFGNPCRTLFGGIKRVSGYNDNPNLFTGQQAPADGDKTLVSTVLKPDTPQTSYRFDSNFDGWIMSSQCYVEGTWSERPSTTLGAANRGTQFVLTSNVGVPSGRKGLIIFNGVEYIFTDGTTA